MIKRAFSSARKIPVPQIEKCYYKTLGVSKDTNSHDIRQNYLTLAKAWTLDKSLDEDQKDDALAYYTHLTKVYETLHDDDKRAIYDEDQISDEDFFTLQLGPLRINLFLVFIVSSGISVAYFASKKMGLLSSVQDKGGACPIDHKSRDEMVQIAKN